MAGCHLLYPYRTVRGQMDFDILFQNVTIVDGTGKPAFLGAVGVTGDTITAVVPGDGTISGADAARVVEGSGKILAPGFIDIHTHSDLTVLHAPRAESRILQGVTTELCGNCGMSSFPIRQDRKCDYHYYLSEYVNPEDALSYSTLPEFVSCIEKAGHSTNLGFLVGHGNIRLAVMGFRQGEPDQAELREEKKLLEEALDSGAFGMSSGLIYPPGSFASSRELEALAARLKPYGAMYTTHMRGEGLTLVNSVKEAIALAEHTGVRVEISHFKECRKEMWHTAVKEAMQLVINARARGLDIAFDQYPYQATASGLETNIPSWAFEGGQDALKKRLCDPKTRARLREEADADHKERWGDIYVSYAEGTDNQQWIGRSIAEIAEATGKDPADACFDVVLNSDFKSNEVNFGMCEEDIEYILSQDFGMICSDGEDETLNFPGVPHPRIYGTFPRILARYVKKRRILTLEKAISKMTGMSAARMGLADRGLIREGMKADLVLFDYNTIEDTPDYLHPEQACRGIEEVCVNGVLTASHGTHTGARAGSILKRN